MDDHLNFLLVAGVFFQLVVVSMLLERAMAVIFEYEWFVRLTTREVTDPNDKTKTIIEKRWSGLKGALAMLASFVICYIYKFDAFLVVLQPAKVLAVPPVPPGLIGIFITSLIVTGGSAGAILLFQGYLNFSKQARDAIVETKKASAEADKADAEADKAVAEARKKPSEAQPANP
ncbi:MAG: hypothetical protein HQK59_06000 [Deltaproteobacteria bacterium]|nr:hypothetical protein [Deltaproteobacteria bacterium]